MIAPPALDLGSGPPVVLLHGVGPGPGTFSRVARELASDHRVVVLERAWDPDRPPTLAEQAAAVCEAIGILGLAHPTLVGVSGGATLSLVVAIHHPDCIGGLVVHEPLVGPAAPALHRTFADAAERAARSDRSALEVVRTVLGEATWQALTPTVHDEIRSGAARARAEIPVFAAFAPTADQLATLGARPVLVTVGERSGEERSDAAAVLVDLAGARLAVLPGAGNAAQLDAPDAFAALVRGWCRSPEPCGA